MAVDIKFNCPYVATAPESGTKTIRLTCSWTEICPTGPKDLQSKKGQEELRANHLAYPAAQPQRRQIERRIGQFPFVKMRPWRRKRSKLSLSPLSPVVANILQVAYYRGVLVTRARMLESRGHHVTSVLGNDEALRLDAAVIAAADSIVIGFSAPYPVRAAMIHWFKELYPNTPVAPCNSTAPRASPRPMAAPCPMTPKFGLQRS